MLARRSAHIILIPLILALAAWYFTIWQLGVLLLVAFGVLLVFFRDPERVPGEGVVSAADGVVQSIEQHNGHLAISTFMNFHNVHVNRAPIGGKVVGVERMKGGFWPAFTKRADSNARSIILMETEIGAVRIIQIAGTFAWRIVPYVRVGQIVNKGERIGIIRFGSRVDVELPAEKIRCVVKAGQKLLAGVSDIAEAIY